MLISQLDLLSINVCDGQPKNFHVTDTGTVVSRGRYQATFLPAAISPLLLGRSRAASRTYCARQPKASAAEEELMDRGDITAEQANCTGPEVT